MNTPKLALASTLLVSLVTIGASAEARDRVDRRQGHQAARVHEGRQSGELTNGEAARVQQSKRVIRRNEKRAEADGTVTPEEQQRLEKMQDARSQQIHRLKNNDKNEAPEASSENQ